MKVITPIICLIIFCSVFFISCDSDDIIPYEPITNEFCKFDNWPNSQAGAIYGNFLISVMACDEVDDNTNNAFIWDLYKGEKVAELTLDYTFNGRKYYKPHANTVCFGGQVSGNHDFPLLYVSQSFGSDYGIINYRASGVLVYQLEESISGYTATIVQTIMPSQNDDLLISKIGSSVHNYIVDKDCNLLYVIGTRKETWFDAKDEIIISSFKLPDPSTGGEVVLTNDMIQDSFSLPMAYCLQACFYEKGNMYIMNGDSSRYKWIRCLNLKSKEIKMVLDFSYMIGEPQFCGCWNDNLFIYFGGESGYLYHITSPSINYKYDSMFH